MNQVDVLLVYYYIGILYYSIILIVIGAFRGNHKGSIESITIKGKSKHLCRHYRNSRTTFFNSYI